MIADINVQNIDVDLLREQRDYLLKLQDVNAVDEIQGIINLLDAMLDNAEGF